jgi:hypothetical protein
MNLSLVHSGDRFRVHCRQWFLEFLAERFRLVGGFFAADSVQSFPNSLITKGHTDGMQTLQIRFVGPFTLWLTGLSNGLRRVRVRRRIRRDFLDAPGAAALR